ncbi:MAG: formimidoylglutamate deiminase [Acidobacteria bacterium]|nr:formimidoylglutamate deiminase [Acidobacteriota bacterium]
MTGARTIKADLVWTGEAFEPDRLVAFEEDSSASIEPAGNRRADLRLEGKALIPGFVNAHSHSFQRALRGRTERFPGGRGSFWSWRKAMYALVDEIDPETLKATAVQAFTEMRNGGITSVGEFHYLHHGSGRWDLDDAVIEAASEAGIRMVLLQTYYERGGFDSPLEPAQARFASESVSEFIETLDRLRARTTNELVSFGIAAHSLRAVSLASAKHLWEAAAERNLPFHMHLEEQRQEIEECQAAHGATPMRLVLDELGPDSRFTAVHATHTAPAELEELASRGGRVCITPLTEGNLGDGVQPLAPEIRSQLSLGTDSNARISFVEEMRWLEYVQRLVHEKRGAFVDGKGMMGIELLRIATEGGAASLRGTLRHPADYAVIDLTAPSLAGWTRESLLDSIISGSDNSVVAGTIIGGRFRESGENRRA